MFYVYILQSATTAGVMWAPVRTSMNEFIVTLPVTQNPRDTVSRGFCFAAKVFRLGQKRQEKSAITKADAVETNSTAFYFYDSAVAAATGRGFESRRPDPSRSSLELRRLASRITVGAYVERWNRWFA